MSLPSLQWVFLAVALLMANLPWLSQRCFLVLQCERKPVWVRLLEWLALYVVAGGLGLLLEQRAMGSLHAQDWEFYWVTFFLFMVFAFPGFVYRYVR
ncbi:DUF2818 family protein [Candidatus Thiothrix sp. Deng01]|uniref:DUF2818 family protein n=1 Tax=Candidatus Thiothrix phosphatis TaxID=3112415 RepID=A0ABU6D0X9_9GAMM|nr:DUF2818 family protein [Candidatus Thiothrix sp. Deng01]MEB4592442.1 DUF2818 family protein [Candidatus Thiothrix sp. Deng01]